MCSSPLSKASSAPDALGTERRIEGSLQPRDPGQHPFEISAAREKYSYGFSRSTVVVASLTAPALSTKVPKSLRLPVSFLPPLPGPPRLPLPLTLRPLLLKVATTESVRKYPGQHYHRVTLVQHLQAFDDASSSRSRSPSFLFGCSSPVQKSDLKPNSRLVCRYLLLIQEGSASSSRLVITSKVYQVGVKDIFVQ